MAEYRRGADLQQELEDNNRLYQASLREITGVNKESHPLVELASFSLPEITQLSKQRIKYYLQHLENLINLVFEDKERLRDVIFTKGASHIPAKVTQLNEKICTKCKGRCCLNAGDESYLQVATIRHYVALNPYLSAAQIKNNYQQYIPEKTYSLSCINHTEFGCALPKAMRSEMCNNFYCSTVKEFNALFFQPKTTPEGAIVIARSLEEGQKQVCVVKI